jgi:hypothetical protein
LKQLVWSRKDFLSLLNIVSFSLTTVLSVGKCRPQVDQAERSEDWFGQEILYCRVGERAKRGREKGRGLNTHQWDSAWSDWLGSYGSCWLEVGAEGEFKLDLRQDCDSGKQRLKGVVRTETYLCHYCQHYPLYCFNQFLSHKPINCLFYRFIKHDSCHFSALQKFCTYS